MTAPNPADLLAEHEARERAYLQLVKERDREEAYRIRALAELAKTSAELASARQEIQLLREQNERLNAHLDEVVAAYDALIAHQRQDPA